MQSSLYWFKPVAEIKKKKKTSGKTAFGRNAFCLVGDAVQRQPVCWRPIGLLETHCLPVFTRSTNNPRCGLLLTAVGWNKRSDMHAAIQLRPDICAVITSLPRGSEEKHSQISYLYSCPLSCLRNCCPIHRICCQVVPAMAVSSQQTAFGKQNT